MRLLKILLLVVTLSLCTLPAFASVNDNVGSMDTGPIYDETKGTVTLGAGPTQILSGYSAWVDGNPVIGSMPDYSDAMQDDATITESDTNAVIKVPKGYYDSDSSTLRFPIVKTAVDVPSLNITPGTATFNDILFNKTAWVNVVKLTGIIHNFTNLTKASEIITATDNAVDVNVPDAGYYTTGSKVAVTVSDLQNSSTDLQNNSGEMSYEVDRKYDNGDWLPINADDEQVTLSATTTYDYTGDTQSYTVANTGLYKVNLYGAAGASGTKGHSVSCNYYAQSGDNLNVIVGGAGVGATGGYNGGGNGASNILYAGGGASAVTLGDNLGVLKDYESNVDNIIAVAAGGGGQNATATRVVSSEGKVSSSGDLSVYGSTWESSSTTLYIPANAVEKSNGKIELGAYCQNDDVKSSDTQYTSFEVWCDGVKLWGATVKGNKYNTAYWHGISIPYSDGVATTEIDSKYKGKTLSIKLTAGKSYFKGDDKKCTSHTYIWYYVPALNGYRDYTKTSSTTSSSNDVFGQGSSGGWTSGSYQGTGYVTTYSAGNGGGGGGYYGGKCGYSGTDYIKSTIIDKSSAADARAGNGSVSITQLGARLTRAQVDTLQLHDYEKPDSVNSLSFTNDSDGVSVSWDKPDDNGTMNYLRIRVYNGATATVESSSKEANVSYASGVKGYYYRVDTDENGTLTSADNFTDSCVLSNSSLEIGKVLHIASVDNDGNISDTTSWPIVTH